MLRHRRSVNPVIQVHGTKGRNGDDRKAIGVDIAFDTLKVKRLVRVDVHAPHPLAQVIHLYAERLARIVILQGDLICDTANPVARGEERQDLIRAR